MAVRSRSSPSSSSPVNAMVTCGVRNVGTTSKPPASRSATANTANRESPQGTGAEIIDVGVALGVHPREPPTAPIGETTTEQLGLDSGIILHVVLAAHHDQGVDRNRHPPDPWYPLGHWISNIRV